MSEPNQGDPTDLFDFPEVEGMEAFGLTPPPGWGEGADLERGEEVDDAAPAAESDAATDAPSEAAPDEAAPAASGGAAGARPNPPVPGDVDDLDEDLFGFDELFSQDDDPYQNGTLTADGQPVNPAPPASAPEAAPQEAATPEAAREAAPGAAPGAATGAATGAEPGPAAAPLRSETVQPQPRPEPTAPAAAGPASPEAHGYAAGSLMSQPAERAALDRGPRILLPEDVPYGPGATGRDARIIWALVACFLIVNTGIFWLAHLASTNVNQSITNATGVIAEALAGRGGAPVYGAAPPVAPEVVYESIPRDESDAPAREPEPWVDPRNFEGTHRFAVGRAKAHLAEGRFEDARRLLFYVLANQDRVPLAPELREEIDYLIPLTYYDQGRATAEPSESDAEVER